MNIIFFGSDNFAVLPLESLFDSKLKISCVVTQPDKKKGRGLHLDGTDIKKIASRQGIEIFQPEDINYSDSINFLRKMQPDLFIVIAYGQIFSKELLEIPRSGSINIHASLLPKYRGAAPINWAVINGERSTGVSAIKMSEKMDAGEIIGQKEIGIDIEDTSATLANKLSNLGSSLLLEVLNAVQHDKIRGVKQDEGMATFAPKLKKDDGSIDWNKSAQEIHNLVRGCVDWPGAFTYYKGKLLKIIKARVIFPLEEKNVPGSRGEIIKILKDDLIVTCGKGDLVIEELQIEGKRRMLVKEFIAGHKVFTGDIFGR